MDLAMVGRTYGLDKLNSTFSSVFMLRRFYCVGVYSSADCSRSRCRTSRSTFPSLESSERHMDMRYFRLGRQHHADQEAVLIVHGYCLSDYRSCQVRGAVRQ
jgi:hypothetical protein